MPCFAIESLSRAESNSSTQLNWTFGFLFSFLSFTCTWENMLPWNLAVVFTLEIHGEILSFNGITWFAPRAVNKKVWVSNLRGKLPRLWKKESYLSLFKNACYCNFIRVSFTHTGGLGASDILGSLDPNKYLGKLISFLDPVLPTPSHGNFFRCWHAKTDGWAASTFHSNCDGRGPTVTIIKVNDSIFGGYTDVSWSGGRHIKFFNKRRDKFIRSHSSWDLNGRGGGGEGAGGNMKRCSSDKSSKPLLFHTSFLAIKISSHLYRL